MTDNEIIKALEWCGKADCVGCPYVHLNCRFEMARKAPFLINRQKAESERLQKHIQDGIDLAKQLPEMIMLSKAEAIKEFAERLKNKLTSCSKTIDGKYEYLICDFEIDTLVKEMVGDNNG